MTDFHGQNLSHVLIPFQVFTTYKKTPPFLAKKIKYLHFNLSFQQIFCGLAPILSNNLILSNKDCFHLTVCLHNIYIYIYTDNRQNNVGSEDRIFELDCIRYDFVGKLNHLSLNHSPHKCSVKSDRPKLLEV